MGGVTFRETPHCRRFLVGLEHVAVEGWNSNFATHHRLRTNVAQYGQDASAWQNLQNLPPQQNEGRIGKVNAR